ncbi:NUDIX hydrolase [Xanthobacter autotrophicus]|uniref:NUDIX hydrolase n=1 Tax=Xanthobacter autotrophicus TaxID=280 RepID=UPI0024A66DC6|nr:NUDIX hydrolase [Xanthobacter autotrophicus]MDI4656410.1 NUDIX hydrolase [Xanthobacter autotrophicus]
MEDRPARVDVEGPELLAKGFRPYERYRLVLHHDDGTSDAQVRDIVRGGRVVGVLGYDPGRDLVVLIRQFRLTAHLSQGRGEMVEIVAGLVEAGEDPEAAAVRECIEETGVEPRLVLPMLSFTPTPGVTDEFALMYLGILDADALPARAGARHETEMTQPFAVPVDGALAAIAQGRCINGFLILALQWLALNRARLPELIAAAERRARS